MKYFSILALSIILFASCCENTYECKKRCQRVTISDANPVQFWVNGKQTFNEKEVDGVFRKCFCAPWNCDDVIKLQFSDTLNATYYLKIYDSDGNTLQTLSFTKVTLTGRYLYSISFVPRNYDICNENIQLIITDNSSVEYASYSNSSYSGWQNSGTGEFYWLIGNYVTPSKYLVNSITPAIQGEADCRLTVDINGGLATLKAYLSQSSGSSRFLITSTQVIGGTYNFDFETDVPGGSGEYDQIELYTEGVGNYGLTINSVTLTTNRGTRSVLNNSFVGSLSPWTNEETGNEDWGYSSGAALVTLNPPGAADSDRLKGVLNLGLPITTDTISFSVTVLTGLDADLEVYFYDGTSTVLFDTQNLTGTLSPVTLNFSGALSGFTNPVTHILFKVLANTAISSQEFYVQEVSDIVFYDEITIPNSSFTTGSDWVNTGNGESWTVGSGTAFVAGPTAKFATKLYGAGQSRRVMNGISVPDGVYSYDFKASITSGSADFILEFYDDGELVETRTETLSAADGIKQYTGSFVGGGLLNMVISVSKAASGESTFNVYELKLLGISAPAKSDCLSIKEDHKETVLITYSNNRDFADVNNLNVSPDTEFNLRIPAIFFHENFPSESEVIELSNSREIQTYAQIKATRRLQIKQVPYYMHKKIILALSMQTVEIDDQQWVKADGYEIVEGNNRYPLKQGNCVLTEKDYIKRNIL